MQIFIVLYCKANNTVKRESNELHKVQNKFNPTKTNEATSSANLCESSNSRISKVYLQANYQEENGVLARVTNMVTTTTYDM